MGHRSMRSLMASNLSELVDHLLVVGRFVATELRGGILLEHSYAMR